VWLRFAKHQAPVHSEKKDDAELIRPLRLQELVARVIVKQQQQKRKRPVERKDADKAPQVEVAKAGWSRRVFLAERPTNQKSAYHVEKHHGEASIEAELRSIVEVESVGRGEILPLQMAECHDERQKEPDRSHPIR
jgi:hypothetical protein